MVKSKYSITTYVNLFFGFAFIGVLVYLSTIIDPWQNSKKIPVPNFIFFIFLFLLILLLFYKTLKTAPRFFIDKNTIRINGLLIKKEK